MDIEWPPSWWWPGFLIQLVVFITLLLLFTWWLMRWAARQVDQVNAEIKSLENEMKTVEQMFNWPPREAGAPPKEEPPEEYTLDEVW